MKIKVKYFNEKCQLRKLKIGDWIDLRAAATMHFNAPQAGVLEKHQQAGEVTRHRDVSFDLQYIPLGVAMELPKGYEAHVLIRHSMPKKLGIIMANSKAVIDNSFKGDNDQWIFPAIALRDTTIEEGTPIAQFRVELSQKATRWQKFKHVFSSGNIELKVVEHLNNEDRGEGVTG